MSWIDILILVVIAGIVGSIGQAIAGITRGGCIVSIVLGFIGALIGMWLARLIGLPEPLMVRLGGTEFPILWSIIGSTLFVAVIGFLTRRRRR
jgi:uncharacterized membrane protein YeaQ/YmgE (transglycosylase-associated protein family)